MAHDVAMDMEGRIRVMPEALANKIAAGEVVQRPASAVKELLENAVDAGAGAITLILKKAGAELIQIVDDGCGMSPEDAAACFLRHATSKLFSAEDLNGIRTLGFRGEALASIAAVAQVELRTKRASDAAGCCIRNEGGRMAAPEPCAMSDGTSLAVRNLFYNVPARRNFLKTPATELRRIVETFQALALSRPDIAFTLMHDDAEMHRLPAESGSSDEALRARIGALLGAKYPDMLIPVEEASSYLSAHGFVGQPELHRKHRNEQFLFVNGRTVKSRSLGHAIHSAYEGLLPEGTWPFFCVFLSVDPSRVDVNVHPAKSEVRFDDERGVYGFMHAVVRKGLGAMLFTPSLSDAPVSPDDAGLDPSKPWLLRSPAAEFVVPGLPRSSDASGSSEAYPTGVSDRWASYRRNDPGAGEQSDALYRGAASLPIPDTDSGDADTLLWQLHGRYILTQIKSGLMIIDQHAAHERILYERALGYLRQGQGLAQQLLFAHTVEFPPADFALLKELLPDLSALGFDIDLSEDRTVVVRGVPSEIHSGDQEVLLEDILDQYRRHPENVGASRSERLAKSLAQRGAIQPGAILAPAEMRSIIDQLFACETPYACPRGRATVIRLPLEELKKRFGH